MARPSKILSKEEILGAQSQTRSNLAASRYLRVSYNHYKKYAKMYKNEDGIELLEVHKNQEGRGIGLFNKINAYALQDQGQDTIQANHSLGFGTDLRNFSIAVKVLEHFKIKSIELLSNNPEKIKIWKDSKIDVTERIPLIMETNEHNLGYLSVKKEKMNHLLFQ